MTETASTQLRRILGVLPTIADGNEHQLGDVAERAGVTKHVLLRDLKSVADRFGEPGGFVEGMQIYIGQNTVSVRSDEFLRPMGLTHDELRTLELGLAVLRAERPPDETVVIDRARERLRKIIAKLPGDFDAVEMRYIEIAPTEGLDHLGALREAARDRRKVRILYRRSGAAEPAERVVRPYAIVPASGMWYAVAYCEESEGLRIFRLDRIEAFTPLEDTYEVPAGFSVSGVLREGKALHVDPPAESMKVRYSPRIARWIAEREGVEPDEDGSLTVEHPLADPDWGVRHVLQYGPEAEVLEPASLRAEVVLRLNSISPGAPRND